MPSVMRNIAGIVLAGGRSSRMSKNKALLLWEGVPLVEHMANILRKSGVSQVLISGAVEGFETIPDKEPFSGPAKALGDLISSCSSFEGFLCVPVDMPLLTPDMLRTLTDIPQGACFEGYPLPAYLPFKANISSANSMRELVKEIGISCIPLPADWEKFMANANTPEEWKKVGGL